MPRPPTCATQSAATSCSPRRPVDVVWTYSGVRPLLDDESGNPSAVTRDYLLELDDEPGAAPLVFGGKITTFASSPRKPPTSLRPDSPLAHAPATAARPFPAESCAPSSARRAGRHRLRALRGPALAARLVTAGGDAASHGPAYGTRSCSSSRRRSRAEVVPGPARRRARLSASSTGLGDAAPTTCSGGAASSACISQRRRPAARRALVRKQLADRREDDYLAGANPAVPRRTLAQPAQCGVHHPRSEDHEADLRHDDAAALPMRSLGDAARAPSRCVRIDEAQRAPP